MRCGSRTDVEVLDEFEKVDEEPESALDFLVPSGQRGLKAESGIFGLRTILE